MGQCKFFKQEICQVWIVLPDQGNLVALELSQLALSSSGRRSPHLLADDRISSARVSFILLDFTPEAKKTMNHRPAFADLGEFSCIRSGCLILHQVHSRVTLDETCL